MERLVEGCCVPKHPSHIRHVGDVPLVERLVEGCCVLKHTYHIRHIGQAANGANSILYGALALPGPARRGRAEAVVAVFNLGLKSCTITVCG